MALVAECSTERADDFEEVGVYLRYKQEMQGTCISEERVITNVTMFEVSF